MSQPITQKITISENTIFEGHHSDPGVTRSFPGKITGVENITSSFAITPDASALAATFGTQGTAALAALVALGIVGKGAVSSCAVSPSNPKQLDIKYWCEGFTKVEITADVTFEVT